MALHTVTVPIVVTAGDASESDPGADHEVTEEVLRLEVARTRREARDAAERGDYGTASQLMSTGADVLTSIHAPISEIHELRRDAASLMVNEWSPEAAKRNFSRSRSTSRAAKPRLCAHRAGRAEGLTHRVGQPCHTPCSY